MLIDCDACTARGPGCDDCVVTALLAMEAPRTERPAAGLTLDLDQAEEQAMRALADAGLVAPLRMVPVVRITPSARSSTDMSPARDIA